MSSVSARAACVLSATVLPAVGSDLIWSRWRTLKNNLISALAAMVGHA